MRFGLEGVDDVDLLLPFFRPKVFDGLEVLTLVLLSLFFLDASLVDFLPLPCFVFLGMLDFLLVRSLAM
jgi:hypothetical protein